MLNPTTIIERVWGVGTGRRGEFRKIVPEGDIILCVSDDQKGILESLAEAAKIYNGRNHMKEGGVHPYFYIVGYADVAHTNTIYTNVQEVLSMNEAEWDAETYKETRMAPNTFKPQFSRAGILEKLVLADHSAGPKPGSRIYHVQDLNMSVGAKPGETVVPGKAMIQQFDQTNEERPGMFPNVVFIWSTLSAGKRAFSLQMDEVANARYINILPVPKRPVEGSYGLGFLEDVTKALTGDAEFPVINARTYAGQRIAGLNYNP
ncbi:MAG TPA: hypothetical protein HA360_01560 [Nanoarchaeota archaeon]|nr:hypothetical protein [uncultured archaeon]MBS3154496.1 hypothetical protein [Candidatus Woesearchaeota archaeon]HIH15724.1 hypothetical protein [Nanoarchaeota archaeon]HIH58631.1 hypothetical protein [Nanoarchaeota archaeon]HII13739.1 hypothetical protein [Nanoarchaeota archaeon]